MSRLDVDQLKALLPLLRGLVDNNGEKGDFEEGDRIKIELSADILEQLQDGHGGWNPEMANIINVPGTIETYMRDNDYLVQFDNGLQFCVNSAAFTRCNEKVQRLSAAIKPGDIVKIDMDVEKMRRLQENYGGFNERMPDMAGKYGYVTSRNTRQIGVIVGPYKFGWNPELLTRLSPDEIAQLARETQNTQSNIDRFDIVEVSNDLTNVKTLQNGHGEWVDAMQHIVGKYGFVKKVFPTKDLRLRVQGRSWTVNHMSCRPILRAQMTASGTERREKPPLEDPQPMIQILLKSLNSKENIFQAAADGNLEMLKRLASRRADFDERLDSFDVIHIAACFRDNVEVLKYLVQLDRRKLTVADREGNTALHFAGICNNASNIACLLDLGANVMARDKIGQSPLHKTVWKDSEECIQLLINRGAPINMKDNEYGHTPLHDAITYKAHKAAEILIQRGARLTVENNCGFSPVFWTALKGERHIFHLILEANGITKERLLNARMQEGYSILHLLTVNNHCDCFQDVMDHFPEVDLDVFATAASLTPLHMACRKLVKEMVELLLIHGANPNVKDIDGDTPLHLCLLAAKQKSHGDPRLDVLKALLGALVTDKDQVIKDICLSLLSSGANLYEKNLMGKSPLELCPNENMATFLVEQFSQINVPIRPSLSGEPSVRPVQSPSTSQPSTSSSYPSSSSSAAPKVVSGVEYPSKSQFKTMPSREEAQQPPDKKGQFFISNIGHSQTQMYVKNDPKTPSKGESSSTETREVSNAPDSKECPICRDKSVDTFLPCGHLICRSCCSRCYRCPFCRTSFDIDDLEDFQSLK